MALRTVVATRYVTPLREGGSVPALLEADDLGTYVVKLRGAAQGPRALVAELIAGEIARALGLPIPELVLVEIDAALGRAEPDPELQGPLRASAGLNLGLDFLPGAIAYDPALGAPAAALASEIVWFDALVANVDRTPRNSNLLLWHRGLQLIDHGAAIYHHHDWATFAAQSRSRFPAIRDQSFCPRPTASPPPMRAWRRASTRPASPRSSRAFRTPGWARAPPRRGRPTSASSPSGWRRRARSWRRPSVPARSSFDYAVVRVVPRIERGERINVGVILHCPTRDFLDARIALDRARLAALDPAADVEEVERALALVPLVCAGDPRAGALARLSRSERFHWLVSPRSTVVQTSRVHTGLCGEPAAALDRLVERLVLPLPPRR